MKTYVTLVLLVTTICLLTVTSGCSAVPQVEIDAVTYKYAVYQELYSDTPSFRLATITLEKLIRELETQKSRGPLARSYYISHKLIEHVNSYLADAKDEAVFGKRSATFGPEVEHMRVHEALKVVCEELYNNRGGM